MALESWLQNPTCEPQHLDSWYTRQERPAGPSWEDGNWPSTLPRDLEALETVGKEAWGQPRQHVSKESSSAIWVEVGDTPGPTEAQRS